MSHATAENLESAARMAMAPPYEEGRSRVTSSRWALMYALYAAAMAILLVGAAAVVSV